MGLGKRRHIRYGIPDAVALGLIVLVVLCAVVWAQSNLEPAWDQAPGSVVACELIKREYGGAAEPEQVRLTYEYHVQGHAYTGNWEGFWPQAHSPNALPRSELAQLRTAGFPLTVAFNPADPAMNVLHRDAKTKPQFYPWLTLGLLGITVVYLLRIYPLWKRPRG